MTKFLVIVAIVCSIAGCVNDPTTSQDVGWKTGTDSSSSSSTATSTAI